MRAALLALLAVACSAPSAIPPTPCDPACAPGQSCIAGRCFVEVSGASSDALPCGVVGQSCMCTVGAMTFVSSYRCVDGGAYCNCDPDAAPPPDAPADTTAPDVAVDDAASDAPRMDAAPDAPVDVAAVGDAASDAIVDAVPDGARVNCADRFYRCSTHEDCQALCAPRTDGHDWCCLMNSTCGTTSSFSCLR